MTAGKAWLTLVTAITAWEIYALRTDADLLLSRGLDRARASHPVANVAILAAIAATAGHLSRLTPPRLDVFALLHIA